MTGWPPEAIPDEDTLYLRVHRNYFLDGELQPGVFRDHGDGMSTHWSKYCTSASAARMFARHPADNGVVSLLVGAVRATPLIVAHTPVQDPPDRSHADVIGLKTAEVRLRLLDLSVWEIRPTEPLDVTATS
jgi:hypothetical protein